MPGFKSDDGLGLQQWVCNADVNQRWLLASLTQQQLPLSVDESFVPEIWEEASDYATMTPATDSDTRTCSGARAPGGRGDCHRVTLDSFYEDGFDTGAQSMTLTTEWETYSLAIPSADYSAGVLRAFHFTVDLALNTAPMKFYVDDIVWE